MSKPEKSRITAINPSDRARACKRMAWNMAKMIDWPAEDTFVRASGDCVCCRCGAHFFDHPHENGLNLLCDGSLVKL